MLILLPPSEGKSEGSGPAMKPSSLAFAKVLSGPRKEVLDALVRVSGGPKAKALATLGLSASMPDLLSRNVGLAKALTAPAMEIYTGVLFEALDWNGLSAKARDRGEQSILISSALFGVVGPQDRIPAYRLSMDVTLPGVGGLASFWKPKLEKALAPIADDLIVDCRSSTYAASWTPPSERTYSVRVMTEKAGKRTVVSHMAKHSRGVLARLLLSARKTAATIEDVVAIASTEFKVEVEEPGRRSGVLTLITRG